MVVNLYTNANETSLEVDKILGEFMKVFMVYVVDSHSNSEELKKVLNKTQYPSENEGRLVVSAVKEGFNRYLDEYCAYITGFYLSEEDIEWLKNNLQIYVSDKMTDTNEGGNSWYWLHHSKSIVNQ